jgi:hypothetical protein
MLLKFCPARSPIGLSAGTAVALARPKRSCDLPMLLLLAGYLTVHFFVNFKRRIFICFAEDSAAVLPPSVAYTASSSMLFHAFL